MPKVLFTTVCRPIGPSQGDAPSVGYELLFGQVTRAQGVFSPRATHVQFGLEYIANNIDSPATVLQYPSTRELIRELKRGYDFIAIAFIMATFHHMEKIVKLVRRYAPKTKIVLGGYGTILSDEELAPYADHICRGEGVAFMRELLGETPRPMPYEHPIVISKLKLFSLPVSKTGMVFAGLGCANGCDFCCTSHFFKRRHIRLLDSGKDIYDVLCRYQDEHGISQFTILDEDFLLNKRRADEFRAAVKKGRRTFGIFCFASIRALDKYTPETLLEMGIDGLWIGYEGTRSGYEKQKGRPPEELFPDLRRHGIMVLASMIVGFDYQTPAVVREELRGLLKLRPTLSQFLIYGPTPGTPFYDRIQKEGRLRPELRENRRSYYRNCTGFKAMVTHPTMRGAEIEALQRECFEEDYRRLGPSSFRTIRVWAEGLRNLRRSANPALRRKAARFRIDLRRAYPLFLAARLFAPNKRIRRWLSALEKRAHAECGIPNWWESLLSMAAVGAAAWTRFTLLFDAFQHPRLGLRRFRWTEAADESFKLSAETGRLKVTLERRWKEGVARIRLKGVLDAQSAESLSRRLTASLAAGRERIEMDIARLKRFDTQGIAILAKSLRNRGTVRLTLPARLRPSDADLLRLRRILEGPRLSGA